jgi:cyclic pyranopterin phosphate synthase
MTVLVKKSAPDAINAMANQHIGLLEPAQLVDQFGRHKHKLRISLTDRCNFRCSYCMPEQPEWLAKKDILNFEELLKFTTVMVKMGIRHIRLTGGEPLMRQGVVHFIKSLNELKKIGLQRISMTTNAYYLTKYAKDLKLAGLDDLNVSLDSINPDTFLKMTKRPLQPVLDGINAAKLAGIPLKLNCVLLAGDNDEHSNDLEIVELTQWAYQQQIPLRFIEYMPLDEPDNWARSKVVTEDQIIEQLQPFFKIEKQQRHNEPATIYRLNDAFDLGVISTISKPFCQTCDRLRITATGELFTCLFADTGTPLRPYLAQTDTTLLQHTISQAVWYKDAGYISKPKAPVRKISMHAMGG